MPLSSESLRSRASTAVFASVALYLAGFSYLLIVILHQSHGHFTYSLDDPYIHLALSERIRHGVYGINAGEPSSPSSSILWPFLFVPFAGTALMTYLPLCLNCVFGVCVAWLLGSLVDRYMPAPRLHTSAGWAVRVLVAFLLLATNTLGLTFTGLEESLELLLCISCAFLCIAAAEGRPIPRWTIIAATLLPLVRYEGITVTLASVVVLWFAGSRRAAALVLLLGTFPMALFSLFLHHLGLPLLPFSVIVKGWMVAGSVGNVLGLLSIGKGALKAVFYDPERSAVFVLAIVCLSLLFQHFRQRRLRPVLLAVSAVAMAQTLYGPFGWLYRYEMYCIGFVLPVLLAYELGGWRALNANGLAAADHLPAPRLSGTLLVAIGAIALVYAPALYATANGAQSVWRQQGQMARLMHGFYKGPVAINDLGLVAYKRDPHAYVLDLAALGSAEVYRMRQQQTLHTHLTDLTREHHIGLVAIYPEWLKTLPAEWLPVAKMCIDDRHYGPADSRVMFYSTPDTNVPELLDELRQFQATLTAGTVLELQPRDSSETCVVDR